MSLKGNFKLKKKFCRKLQKFIQNVIVIMVTIGMIFGSVPSYAMITNSTVTEFNKETNDPYEEITVSKGSGDTYGVNISGPKIGELWFTDNATISAISTNSMNSLNIFGLYISNGTTATLTNSTHNLSNINIENVESWLASSCQNKVRGVSVDGTGASASVLTSGATINISGIKANTSSYDYAAATGLYLRGKAKFSTEKENAKGGDINISNVEVIGIPNPNSKAYGILLQPNGSTDTAVTTGGGNINIKGIKSSAYAYGIALITDSGAGKILTDGGHINIGSSSSDDGIDGDGIYFERLGEISTAKSGGKGGNIVITGASKNGIVSNTATDIKITTGGGDITISGGGDEAYGIRSNGKMTVSLADEAGGYGSLKIDFAPNSTDTVAIANHATNDAHGEVVIVGNVYAKADYAIKLTGEGNYGSKLFLGYSSASDTKSNMTNAKIQLEGNISSDYRSNGGSRNYIALTNKDSYVFGNFSNDESSPDNNGNTIYLSNGATWFPVFTNNESVNHAKVSLDKGGIIDIAYSSVSNGKASHDRVVTATNARTLNIGNLTTSSATDLDGGIIRIGTNVADNVSDKIESNLENGAREWKIQIAYDPIFATNTKNGEVFAGSLGVVSGNLYGGGDAPTFKALQTIYKKGEDRYLYTPVLTPNEDKTIWNITSLTAVLLKRYSLYDAINLTGYAEKFRPSKYDLKQDLALGDGSAEGELPTGVTSLGTLTRYNGARSLSINGQGHTLDGANNGGVVVNSGDTLTISGLTVKGFKGSFVTNNGTLEFIDTNTMENSVVNNKTMTVSGTTTFNSGYGVSGSGSITNSGNLSIDAGQLGNTVENRKTLTLTGNGSTLASEITGSGTTVINGAVATNANIANEITINSGKSLTTLANYLGGDVTNNGQLYLTGKTLEKAISGSGTTAITGDVTSNASIASNTITIGGGMSLSISASLLGGQTTNSGTLTLSDGTLAKAIDGTGQTIIDGAVGANALIENKIIINAEKSLTISAGNVGNTVANSGKLTLTDGTLEKAINGTGDVTITGDVESNANIQANSLHVNLGSTFTTSASTLDIKADSILDDGKLILNAGTLKKAISGSGVTAIAGSVTANASIATDILTIDNGGTLDIAVDNIKTTQNTVTNNGTLNLLGGTATEPANLSREITGSGNTVVTNGGNVASTARIATNAITITEDGKLTIASENLGSAVTNNGTLKLEGNVVGQNVNGDPTILGTLSLSDGEVSFADGVTIKNQIIETSGILKTGKDHLDATDSVTLKDGTINITNGEVNASYTPNVVNLYKFDATNGTNKIVFNTVLSKDASSGEGIAYSDSINISGTATGTLNLALLNANIFNDENFGDGDSATVELFKTTAGGDITRLRLIGQNVAVDSSKSYIFKPKNEYGGELEVSIGEGTTLYHALNLDTPLETVPDSYNLHQSVNIHEKDDPDNAGAIPVDETSLGTLARASSEEPRNFTINGNGYRLFGNDAASYNKAYGGVIVNAGDTLTISNLTAIGFNGAFVKNAGTLNFTGTNYMYNSIENNGTMNITGSTVFTNGAGISGTGSVANYGTMRIGASYLNAEHVDNAGQIVLSNGTLLNTPIYLAGISSVSASTVIDGAVTSHAFIGTPIVINDEKSLTSSASNVGGIVSNEKGTITLTGGTLKPAGLSDEDDSIVAILGKNGQTIIKGDVRAEGKIENKITVNEGMSLSIDTKNIGNTVTNEKGTITLTGGGKSIADFYQELKHDIKGTDKNARTIIDGHVHAAATQRIENSITINKDKLLATTTRNLDSDGGLFGDDRDVTLNGGNLMLSAGGDLTREVKSNGDGEVAIIFGIVDAKEKIESVVEIMNQYTIELRVGDGKLKKLINKLFHIDITTPSGLNIDAENIGNYIRSGGTVTLTGGLALLSEARLKHDILREPRIMNLLPFDIGGEFFKITGVPTVSVNGWIYADDDVKIDALTIVEGGCSLNIVANKAEGNYDDRHVEIGAGSTLTLRGDRLIGNTPFNNFMKSSALGGNRVIIDGEVSALESKKHDFLNAKVGSFINADKIEIQSNSCLHILPDNIQSEKIDIEADFLSGIRGQTGKLVIEHDSNIVHNRKIKNEVNAEIHGPGELEFTGGKYLNEPITVGAKISAGIGSSLLRQDVIPIKVQADGMIKIAPENIGNDIKNLGTVILTDGTLEYVLYDGTFGADKGTTEIDGDVIVPHVRESLLIDETAIQNNIKIKKEKSLTIQADDIGGDVEIDEAGLLTLTGGSDEDHTVKLSKVVKNSHDDKGGDVVIDGYVKIDSNSELLKVETTINEDKYLKIKARGIGADIYVNNAILEIWDDSKNTVTLAHSIYDGQGLIAVAGSVGGSSGTADSDTYITQGSFTMIDDEDFHTNIFISAGASLDINPRSLDSNLVGNSGDLYIRSGTIAKGVRILSEGDVTTMGAVTSKGSISTYGNGLLIVGDSLTIAATNLDAVVKNNYSTLSLMDGDGEIKKDIYATQGARGILKLGQGVTSFATNNGKGVKISNQDIHVATGGTLKTGAGYDGSTSGAWHLDSSDNVILEGGAIDITNGDAQTESDKIGNVVLLNNFTAKEIQPTPANDTDEQSRVPEKKDRTNTILFNTKVWKDETGAQATSDSIQIAGIATGTVNLANTQASVYNDGTFGIDDKAYVNLFTTETGDISGLKLVGNVVAASAEKIYLFSAVDDDEAHTPLEPGKLRINAFQGCTLYGAINLNREWTLDNPPATYTFDGELTLHEGDPKDGGTIPTGATSLGVLAEKDEEPRQFAIIGTGTTNTLNGAGYGGVEVNDGDKLGLSNMTVKNFDYDEIAMTYGVFATVNDGATLGLNNVTMQNSVLNNGTLLVAGVTIFDDSYGISGTGSITNSGELTINTDLLGNVVTNDGTLTLTGGTSSAPVILAKEISGNGSTIIDGVVNSNVSIANAIILVDADAEAGTEAGALTISASNVGGAVTNEEGTLTLLDGDLNFAVARATDSGTGVTKIAGNVTSNAKIANAITIVAEDTTAGTPAGALTIAASNVGGDVANSGNLTLASGALKHNVTGNGATTIAGNVEATENITADLERIGMIDNAMTINEDSSLTIVTHNIGGDITNNGTLTLLSCNNAYREVGKNIYGSGTTVIEENGSVDVAVAPNVCIANKIKLNSANLSIQADMVGGVVVVENNRVLSLYGTNKILNYEVSGPGTTRIEGTIRADALIATAIGITPPNANACTLTIAADNVGGAVTLGSQVNGASATLKLLDGRLKYAIDILKDSATTNETIIDGDVLSSASITTNVLTINAGKSLSTLADNINIVATTSTDNKITNDGTLSLYSGTLNSAVTGSGSTIINGAVKSNEKIDTHLTINEKGSLTISANKVGNTVANEGKLTLTGNGSTLASEITGSGTTVIDGHVSVLDVGGSIANAITINADKSLEIAANNVGGAVSNNGTLRLTGTNKTLSNAVSGNGTTQIYGTITANALIANDITIDVASDSSNSLKIAAENVGGDVTNTGATLTLFNGDGVLAHDVSADSDKRGTLNLGSGEKSFEKFVTIKNQNITTSGKLKTGIVFDFDKDPNIQNNVTMNSATIDIANGAAAKDNANIVKLYNFDASNGTNGTNKIAFNTRFWNDENGDHAESDSINIKGAVASNSKLKINIGKMNIYNDGSFVSGDEATINLFTGNVSNLTLVGGVVVESPELAYIFTKVADVGSEGKLHIQAITGCTLYEAINLPEESWIQDNPPTVYGFTSDVTLHQDRPLNAGYLPATNGDSLGTLTEKDSEAREFTINGNGFTLNGAGKGGITVNSNDTLILSDLKVTGFKDVTKNDNTVVKSVAVDNSGTLEFDGTNYMAASVTNNGTVNVTGAVTFLSGFGIDGGTVTNDGYLALEAIKVNDISTVMNNGKLSLYGNGTQETINKQIGGTGQTIIDGDITSTAVINNSILVNSNRGFTTDADLVGGVVTNNGLFTLTGTGKTLAHEVNGEGETIIDGSITSSALIANTMTINGSKSLNISADNVGGLIVNDAGTLTLTDGTLNYSVVLVEPSAENGIGQTVIAGNVLSNAVIENAITINTNRSLQISASKVGGAVANSGTLTLGDGTLMEKVSGNGLTIIAGTVGSTAEIATKDLTINSESILQIVADNLKSTNAVANNGTLYLGGGTADTAAELSSEIGGNGSTVIIGNVAATAAINNAITINEGRALSIGAGDVGGAVENDGILSLTGGTSETSTVTLAQEVSGYGQTVIDGFVKSSALIANTMIINQDKYLEISAGNVGGIVTNNGTLVLGKGVLKNEVRGNGTTEINDIVASSVRIANAITINGTNSLAISADNVGGAVTNEAGNLTLSSGVLDENVDGAGKTIIAGDVISNNAIANDVTVLANRSLSIFADNLDGAMENRGLLTLKGGTSADETVTLKKAVTGTGLTVIDGFVKSDASIENEMAINDNKYLQISADNVDGTVANSGTLVLTGGTSDTPVVFEKEVSGDGQTVIDGAVESYVNIANEIAINKDRYLEIAASHVGGAVADEGMLKLTAGTLRYMLSGNGDTEISEDVISVASIATNTLTIDSTASLTIAAGNVNTLGNIVTNGGLLTLGTGMLQNAIDGDGSTVINGIVVARESIANDITVNYNKSLTIAADNLGGVVTNNGKLNLSGNVIGHNITASNGERGILRLISGTKTLNATVSNQDVTVMGALKTGENHLDNTDNVTLLNGKIDITKEDTATDTNVGNAVTIKDFDASTGINRITFNTKLSNSGTPTASNDNVTIAGNVAEGSTVKIALSGSNIYNDESFALHNEATIDLFTGNVSNLTLIGGVAVASPDIAYVFTATNTKGQLHIKAVEGCTLYDAINLNSAATSNYVPTAYTLQANTTLNKDMPPTAGTLPATATSLGILTESNGQAREFLIDGAGNTLDGAGFGGVTVNNKEDTLIISNITVKGFKNDVFATNAGTLELEDVVNMENSVVNNGTINVTGETTFASNQGVSGTGNILNTGQFTINAGKLVNTVTNEGKLLLGRGKLTKAISGDNGETIIDGRVTSYARIANAIKIASSKALDISASNVGGTVTNDGTLTLNKGTLEELVKSSVATKQGTVNLADSVNINNRISFQEIVAKGGYSTVERESYIANNNLTFNGGGFDFQNNKVSNHVVKNINLSGDGYLKLDVDLAAKEMDTLSVGPNGTISGSAPLHITSLALLTEATDKVTDVLFTDDETLLQSVVYDGATKGLHVKSSSQLYAVAYDKATGLFTFTKTGANETTKSISDTAVALNFAWLENINNLQKRLGDLRNGEESNTGWVRFQRSMDDLNMGRKLNVSGNLYQIGYDFALQNDKTSRGYFGLSFERMDGNQSFKIGGGDLKSTSVGAYYTKIYNSGHYFDFILRYGRYESDTTSYDEDTITKLDYALNGVTLSGEYGYRANIGKNGFYLEPQTEFIYGYLGGANKTSSTGQLATIDSTNHFVTRLGLSLGQQVNNFNYYLKTSYYHDFAGTSNITYGDASYEQDSAHNWWEVSLGGGWNMSKTSYFYAEFSKYFKDISNSLNFNLGFRFTL